MKLTAITMVRDEADVIERTIRHLAAQGVDEILVYENASTDGTWEILRDLRDGELAGLLTIYPDAEAGYYQSRKMTQLARVALERDADWIIPFDADELWTCSTGLAPQRVDSRLRDLFESIDRRQPGVGVVPFRNYNHYRTHADPGGHPFEAMVWRGREPLELPKVAFRAGPSVIVEAGNHSVRHAAGTRLEFAGLRIHHYPYRSVEQFIRKARNGSQAYAATDLPRSTGQHWREWGDTLREHGEAGLRKWFEDAFVYPDPASAGLVYEPVGSASP